VQELNAMLDRYQRWMDALYLACIWIAGISIAIMSLIIPWGVYTRYVLGTGSQWPEPLAILLMVVFTFFGAAACYRAEAHIAVKLLTDRLPAAAQPAAAWLVDGLLAALSLFMLIWGTQLCIVTWNQVIAEFPFLSVGLTYAPLPLGGAITLLFIVERFVAGSAAGRAVVGHEIAAESAD
jgi:TRAP-type C4-dicarboxylate transport system permease small subunit